MYDLYLRKNPGWDFEEVKKRTLKIAETLDIENLKVFEIYPDMICIEKIINYFFQNFELFFLIQLHLDIFHYQKNYIQNLI